MALQPTAAIMNPDAARRQAATIRSGLPIASEMSMPLPQPKAGFSSLLIRRWNRRGVMPSLMLSAPRMTFFGIVEGEKTTQPNRSRCFRGTPSARESSRIVAWVESSRKRNRFLL
jgi:hypothetical protein